MITNNTKAGLMLREVGLYMPEGDFLTSFAFLPDNTIKAGVKAKALADPKFEIKTYPETIKEAFERSTFLGIDPIVVESREKIEIKGRPIEVLFITMPFVTEKN
jgi:hypothetical protein